MDKTSICSLDIVMRQRMLVSRQIHNVEVTDLNSGRTDCRDWGYGEYLQYFVICYGLPLQSSVYMCDIIPCYITSAVDTVSNYPVTNNIDMKCSWWWRFILRSSGLEHHVPWAPFEGGGDKPGIWSSLHFWKEMKFLKEFLILKIKSLLLPPVSSLFFYLEYSRVIRKNILTKRRKSSTKLQGVTTNPPSSGPFKAEFQKVGQWIEVGYRCFFPSQSSILLIWC
jgi:hypothetical protein